MGKDQNNTYYTFRDEGAVVNFLRRSKPIIDELLGNIEDIIVLNNYEKAIKELQKMKYERDERMRFEKLNYNLRNTILDDEDYYNIKELDEIEIKEPNKLEGTTAYNKWKEKFDNLDKQYKENWEKWQKENPDKTAEDYKKEFTEQNKIPQTEEEYRKDFLNFVKQNQEYYKELFDKGAIGKKIEYIPKTEDEIQATLYKKSGFTPEDITWYNLYKEKKNLKSLEDLNKELIDFVYSRTPSITSMQGRLGDYYAKILGQRASLLQLTPLPEIEDPLSKTSRKDWTIQKIGEKYYYVADYYDQKARKWRQGIIKELTPEEVSEYKKKNKKRIKDLTPEEFNKLTYEELISNYTKDEIEEYIEYFPENIKNKYFEDNPEFKKLYDEAKAKETQEEQKKTSGTGRRRSGRIRIGGLSSDIKPYTKYLSKMSELGLKNQGTEWDNWSEQDKEEYLKNMNIVKNLTGKTDEEIHQMVGEYERQKFKKGDKNKKKKEEIGGLEEFTQDEQLGYNEVWINSGLKKDVMTAIAQARVAAIVALSNGDKNYLNIYDDQVSYIYDKLNDVLKDVPNNVKNKIFLEVNAFVNNQYKLIPMK